MSFHVQQASEPARAAAAQVAGGQIRNGAELHGVVMKRDELRSQLEAITDRRRELQDQLQHSSRQAGVEIQRRMGVLDSRAATIEMELARADDAIANALARGIVDAPPAGQHVLVETTPAPAGSPPLDWRLIMSTAMIAEALGFVLIGFLVYRFMWRRAIDRVVALTSSNSAKFDQLQQAVDVIAVEVERISEGQRYVSKLVANKSSQVPLPEHVRIDSPS